MANVRDIAGMDDVNVADKTKCSLHTYVYSMITYVSAECNPVSEKGKIDEFALHFLVQLLLYRFLLQKQYSYDILSIVIIYRFWGIL